MGLTVSTRNYGDIPTAPLGDLLEDSFLTNISTEDAYFDLVLDDLAPGQYELTTYHHSFDFGGASAEVLGGLEGSEPVFLQDLKSTTGTDISAFAVLTTVFSTTDLVDGYLLRFDPASAAGGFHFDLAGFELDFVPIPEPSTALLLGFGLALVGVRRQPASRG